MPLFASFGTVSARSRGITLPKPGFVYLETVANNVINYNLSTQMTNAGWNGTTFVDATLIVPQNITISASATNVGAIATGNLPQYSSMTIFNEGTIVGAGGNGGNASSGNGSNGGDAIVLGNNTTCYLFNRSTGILGGGGGGGGAGASYVLGGSTLFGGSGGGGGAGTAFGQSGSGVTGTIGNGSFGASGSLLAGGIGGPSVSSSGVIIVLNSGTEYTSSAVYISNVGNSTYWYSINLAGTVTQLSSGLTRSYSGLIGLKLFASTQNQANPTVRSNYVGQFFWQDFTSGNSKVTATIPSTIPASSNGSASTTAIFNLVGYLWGGTGQRSNGTVHGGGYTTFAGPITAGSTIWVICAGAGFRSGNQSSSREPDCRGKSYQGWTDQGGGLSGVFTSDPLNGSNEPLLSAGSTAILGIAGGAGGSYSNGTSGGGGGTTGGGGSSSSKNAGGGTQASGGNSVSSNGSIVRNADFMTGAVVQAGSTTAPGGGGYYGGGGTGGGGESGGGGGGSGYFRTTGGYSGQTTQATNTNPANVGSDYYPGNSVGYGTSGGSDGPGNRGQVRLYLR